MTNWLTVSQAELPFKALEMYLYYPKGVDGPAGRVIVTEAGRKVRIKNYELRSRLGLSFLLPFLILNSSFLISRRAEVESVEAGRRVVEMGGENVKNG